MREFTIRIIEVFHELARNRTMGQGMNGSCQTSGRKQRHKYNNCVEWRRGGGRKTLPSRDRPKPLSVHPHRETHPVLFARASFISSESGLPSIASMIPGSRSVLRVACGGNSDSDATSPLPAGVLVVEFSMLQRRRLCMFTFGFWRW